MIITMPIKKVYKKKSSSKPGKRQYAKKQMRRYARRPIRSIATNTAAVRENYSVSIPDGGLTFFSTALSMGTFDRAQSVAQSFQEYRIKYVKLTFKPSADTFAPAAGNIIPQLYFQMNKYQSVPTGATIQTLLDMGCRPIRFDDKNIVRAYKPVVLTATDTTALAVAAQKSLTTPWLSTNANAQNPGPLWNPSSTEHLGCVFVVQKPNPATPTINYTLDVEVVFQFRRPLWTQSATATNNLVLDGETIRPISSSVLVSHSDQHLASV